MELKEPGQQAEDGGVQAVPNASFWERNKIPMSIFAGAVLISLSILWNGGAFSGFDSGRTTGQTENDSGPLSFAALLSYGREIGLDAEKYEACLSNNETQAIVQQDLISGQDAKVSGTPTFYINGRQLVGALPYQAFEQAIEDALNNRIPESERVAVTERSDAPVIGNVDAPVTMVEFSDFECPYCQRFIASSYPQIKSKYIDTGKVKIVFRHFPLSQIHPNAQKAGEAAECAARQGKFEQMHDLLFAKAQAS